jgi:Na+-translocating ferredoxin:NAD+ oxidoreductase subunit B
MPYSITEKCNGCGACKRLCPAGAIAGEKKVMHVVNATACIECGACGRVCPQGAVLDQNGNVSVMMKRAEWLKPGISLKLCMACSICIEACPVGCLAMSGTPRKGGVDAYPYLRNEKACIGCSFCSKECPVEAILMQKPEKVEKTAA